MTSPERSGMGTFNFDIDTRDVGSEGLTAAELRLRKDLNELELPDINFQVNRKSDEPLTLECTIRPIEGVYSKCTLHFILSFPLSYPFLPPKVRLTNKIFHPNIDPEGHVCLNILRLDWSPVLSLSSIILGLWDILTEPTPDEPLNVEAGELLLRDKAAFRNIVKVTSSGGSYNGIKYDDLRGGGAPDEDQNL